MKKLLSYALLSAALLGCADSKKIDGVTYEPYGLFNDEKMNSTIKYDIVWGNVFWSIVFVETVLMPVYFVGFSIKEPVCRMPEHVGEACGD